MIMEPGITIISDSPIGGRTEEQKADRQAKVQESQDRHQEELDAQ